MAVGFVGAQRSVIIELAIAKVRLGAVAPELGHQQDGTRLDIPACISRESGSHFVERERQHANSPERIEAEALSSYFCPTASYIVVPYHTLLGKASTRNKERKLNHISFHVSRGREGHEREETYKVSGYWCRNLL